MRIVEPDAERKVKNAKTEKGNEEKQSRQRSIGSNGGWERKKVPIVGLWASGTTAPDVRSPGIDTFSLLICTTYRCTERRDKRLDTSLPDPYWKNITPADWYRIHTGAIRKQIESENSTKGKRYSEQTVHVVCVAMLQPQKVELFDEKEKGYLPH